MKPLLRLWSGSPSTDAKEDIEAALRLYKRISSTDDIFFHLFFHLYFHLFSFFFTVPIWAASFNGVTKQRRKNILRAANPNLFSLLKDDSLFSAEESDKLFGRAFLDAMLKEAEDEAKLNSVGRAGGSSSNPKRGFFNRQKSGRSSGRQR